MAAEIEFGLLGPLAVRRNGSVVPVAAGKQQALLACLLLSAGRIVTTGELSEVLWDAEPPPSAAASLQTYVMRLRKSLGDASHVRISAEPGGYQISVAPGELDVDQFTAALAAAQAARRAGAWSDAAARLRAGLALWRGEPLAGVASQLLAAREVPRLAEMRLQALEARIDAELNLGQHAEVIAELRQLAAAHPLRERLHGLLMTALYRAGQRAEALAAYQAARRVLIDELGIDPGPELRQLQRQVLDGDPALAVPPAEAVLPAGPASPPPDRVVPRQLPGAIPHFVGRDRELGRLTSLLDEASGSPRGTVVISAIGGTAGIGKTCLAVRWARQVASQFPDGQLFINLNGFGPSGAPMTAVTAIRRFLDDLGIAPEQIPASPEAQASLYRSLLADLRVLIVLDNASDPAQVRPLLPGGAGCLALVTSRRPLTGLAAADGARLLPLDVLTAAEAIDLLGRRLGQDRITAEPAAAAELAELCAQLPLALSVAAALAAGRPGLPLAALAAELRDARTRLDALDTEDAATDVRTVLSWSCQYLSEPAARLFRLLGVHAGPDITAAAAASLADQDREQATRLLTELTAASLLAEHAPGRYRSHDLLRAYAAEQARERESAAARHAATGRVLDHYLHTAYAASRLLYPYRDPIALGPSPPWAQPAELADRQQAGDWFQAERHVILGAVTQAADAGFHAHAWQLAWTVATFFSWRGYWHEQAQTQQAALGAARLADDLAGQTHAHRFLGQAQRRLGDDQQAEQHLDAALQLSRQLGADTLTAHIYMELTEIFEQRDDCRTALRHAEQALRLYQSAGNQMGVAIALNCAGWQHALLGHYTETLDCSGQAAELFRELGNQLGLGATLDSLGYAHLRLGQYAEAIACCQQALETQGDSGDLGVKALTLSHLGDARQAAGDGESARRAWRQALTLYDGLGDPAAAELRSRLSAGLEVR